MHHAIRAFFVVAGPVGIPIGFVHELSKGFRVALAEQITWSLPTEDCSRRIAPRRAAIRLIAREEVKEQTGLAEFPITATPAAAKNFSEQLLGAIARKKMLLVGGAFIGIAR